MFLKQHRGIFLAIKNQRVIEPYLEAKGTEAWRRQSKSAVATAPPADSRRRSLSYVECPALPATQIAALAQAGSFHRKLL